jgi:hypothetical protein
MLKCIGEFAEYISRGHADFINDVRSLLLWSLTYDAVRVPADIRRRGVVAAGWWPVDIKALEISGAEGLLGVLEHLRREQLPSPLVQSPGVPNPQGAGDRTFFCTILAA